MNDLSYLSVSASLEKSKIASDYPWVALVRITWPDDSVLRLARYIDDLTFDDGTGDATWTAYAWQFDVLEEKVDGSIPTWNVSVSNVGRAVEAMLEELGGGVGGHVAIFIVNLSSLKREPALELYFDIVGVRSDVNFVRFKLGAESPFRIMFPRHTYTPDRCQWAYKSAQCGYTGAMPTCSFQLGGTNGCRAHDNAVRFGACPGIDSNGVRAITIR